MVSVGWAEQGCNLAHVEGRSGVAIEIALSPPCTSSSIPFHRHASYWGVPCCEVVDRRPWCAEAGVGIQPVESGNPAVSAPLSHVYRTLVPRERDQYDQY